MSSPDRPLLSVAGIEVTYNQAILALRGVSLEVAAGQVVALLGANGAGKSTTLKAVTNLLQPERGQIVRGRILLDGEPTAGLSADAMVGRGVVQVLEGRHCFPQLTVEENLVTGALARRAGRREVAADLERIYGYFPRLKEKRKQRAGYTSGGEQQMTAIGRALMGKPRLIVLDEPSMGLAPLVVEEIFVTLRDLNRREGLTLLVAEQNAATALRYADHAYVLENGSTTLGGPAAELSSREDVRELYFGLAHDAEGGFRTQAVPARQSWLH
jgi:branched-chain amino acid transport system ATP-binding protein